MKQKKKQYDHARVERTWQNTWKKNKQYKTTQKKDAPKCFVLDMFPYPSGSGLHVGHPKGYIATDVYSRFKTMNGFNVLHPMGWDAFGLPAEEFAIKNKIHPAIAVKKNVARYKEQLSILGFNYDWEREINTTDPEYYKWTQWAFLQMHKKGLTYESHEPINWCPSCKTGLANEDLENGACERCGSIVEKKPIRQWVIKITEYADRLLKDIDALNWPDSIKEQQKNWIGRSEASEMDFKIYSEKESQELDTLKIVTTRPDTLYGASFIAIAPEHSLIEKYQIHISNYPEVSKYTSDAKKMEGFERGRLGREKTGVLLRGVYALHPFTKKQLPVYSTDFVIPGYGTGAIMGVPAHDQRDFDFAKKFNLPVINVIEKPKQGAYYFNLYDSDNSDLAHQMRSISIQEEYITQSIVSFSLETTEKQALIEILKKNLVGDNKDFLLIEKGETFTLEPKNKLVFSDVYGGDGKHINSDFLNNLYTTDAIKQANTKLVDHKIGGPAVHYKLKDWVFSRQRYWGEPIPLVHCSHCAVKDKKIQNSAKLSLNFYYSEIWKNLVSGKKKIETRALNPEEPGRYFGNLSVGDIVHTVFKDQKTKKIKDEKYFEIEGVKIWKTLDDLFKDKDSLKQIFPSQKISSITNLRKKFADLAPGYLEKIENNGLIGFTFKPKTTVVPVPEKDLPVKLPNVKSYQPTGTGESPLAAIDSWVNVKCPHCKMPAKRETNTMPQWAGSCWYYLRYIDPKNKKELVNKKLETYWQPVDMYVGGAEHATRHLIYARFWHKFLYDIKAVSTKEPFMELKNQGLIAGPDGRKMSKRYGNVINPDDVVKLYGADTLRVYEMFMGPFDQGIAWSTENMIGSRRFLERVWRLKEKIQKQASVSRDKTLESLLHKTIKKVTEDIQSFSMNTAISALMILLNKLEDMELIDLDSYKVFLKLLSPFAPHITEELWLFCGGTKSIHKESWPQFDVKKMETGEYTIVIQINGKMRATMTVDNLDESLLEIQALNLPEISSRLNNTKPNRIIHVKGKLINLVVPSI